MDFIVQSTITCPECGFSRDEKMPTNACMVFWECSHCNALIQPKTGDCCVYCSYGTIPCPPIQASANARVQLIEETLKLKGKLNEDD